MDTDSYTELLGMFKSVMLLRETCFECGDFLDNHDPDCRIAQVLA